MVSIKLQIKDDSNLTSLSRNLQNPDHTPFNQRKVLYYGYMTVFFHGVFYGFYMDKQQQIDGKIVVLSILTRLCKSLKVSGELLLK